VTPDTTAADVLKMAVERFSPGDDGTATYALYLATDKSGEFVFHCPQAGSARNR